MSANVQSIRGILSDEDPVGLFGSDGDYADEAVAIACRLTPTMTAGQLACIAFEEVRRSFGDLAGELDEYEIIGHKLAALR